MQLLSKLRFDGNLIEAVKYFTYCKPTCICVFKNITTFAIASCIHVAYISCREFTNLKLPLVMIQLRRSGFFLKSYKVYCNYQITCLIKLYIDMFKTTWRTTSVHSHFKDLNDHSECNRKRCKYFEWRSLPTNLNTITHNISLIMQEAN